MPHRIAPRLLGVGLSRAEDKAFVAKVAREAPAYIREIRAKLKLPVPSTSALEKAPQWGTVRDVFKAILAVETDPCTTLKRQEYSRWLNQAVDAVHTLWKAGRITKEEADLLLFETQWFRLTYRRMGSCNKGRHVPPTTRRKTRGHDGDAADGKTNHPARSFAASEPQAQSTQPRSKEIRALHGS
jgi:hypothetical protein